MLIKRIEPPKSLQLKDIRCGEVFINPSYKVSDNENKLDFDSLEMKEKIAKVHKKQEEILARKHINKKDLDLEITI